MRCITRRRVSRWASIAGFGAALVVGACAPAAPPASPTRAPEPTTAPSKPAAATTTAAAPTTAPAKPAAQPTSAPAARPTTLEELARYMGPDRQQILEQGAKKEGSVQLYTSGILTSATGEIIKNFESKYGVKVDVYRASNDELATRALQEAAANQNVVDLFETTAQGLVPLKAKNIITDYNSPQLGAFMPDAITRGTNGVSWTIVRESYHGIGWNTNLIVDADVPRTYEDLLDPKWKGQMAVPAAADDTIGAFLQAKGRDYVLKLKEQNVRLMKVSARQVADMIIAGEVPLSFDIASAHVAASREKGAPIQWRPLEPVTTNDGSIAVATKAPHPHAAVLLLDYYLSREAAQSYDKFQYGVPRTDIQSEGTLPTSMKRFYATQLPDYEQAVKDWNKLLLDITTQ